MYFSWIDYNNKKAVVVYSYNDVIEIHFVTVNRNFIGNHKYHEKT